MINDINVDGCTNPAALLLPGSQELDPATLWLAGRLAAVGLTEITAANTWTAFRRIHSLLRVHAAAPAYGDTPNKQSLIKLLHRHIGMRVDCDPFDDRAFRTNIGQELRQAAEQAHHAQAAQLKLEERGYIFCQALKALAEDFYAGRGLLELISGRPLTLAGLTALIRDMGPNDWASLNKRTANRFDLSDITTATIESKQLLEAYGASALLEELLYRDTSIRARRVLPIKPKPARKPKI